MTLELHEAEAVLAAAREAARSERRDVLTKQLRQHVQAYRKALAAAVPLRDAVRATEMSLHETCGDGIEGWSSLPIDDLLARVAEVR